MMASGGSTPVRSFALLGDSNISPHINKTSCRANPSLKSAQVLSCGYMGIFAETLAKVRPDVNVCIIACLTNFLTSANAPSAASTVCQRVEPVLQQVRVLLLELCDSMPERMYLISPPMYRVTPLWYREGLPEILSLFSQTFGPSSDRPPTLHLLPSFATPDFGADGVHLTPFSGLEYVLHLFDSSLELFSMLEASPDVVAVKSCEASRVLEDRVMALEQDHRRLNMVVEKKTAADAEIDDFHQNERFEDSFLISGLPRISSDLFGKAWQDQAVKDVQAVLLTLMGRECNIVFIQNATSRVPNSEVKYHVRMSSVSESKEIRTKFGSFFLGGKNVKPDSLKPINISNRVTPETKTRVEVLKLMAQKYRDSNPDGRAQVIRYEARPLIKITPPSSSSDRRVKVYNFVEACKNLPSNFSSAEMTPILRRINPDLKGQIRSLFIVLSDDLFRQILRKFDKKKHEDSSATASSAPGGSGSASEDTSPSAQAPGQASKGKGRNLKRGPSADIGSQAKK